VQQVMAGQIHVENAILEWIQNADNTIERKFLAGQPLYTLFVLIQLNYRSQLIKLKFPNAPMEFKKVARWFFYLFLPVSEVEKNYPGGFMQYSIDIKSQPLFTKRKRKRGILNGFYGAEGETVTSADRKYSFKLDQQLISSCYVDGNTDKDLLAGCGLYVVWACDGNQRDSCACGKTWEYVTGSSSNFAPVLQKCSNYKTKSTPKYQNGTEIERGNGYGCKEDHTDVPLGRFPETSKILNLLLKGGKYAPMTQGQEVCA
jgi:hypothetical protein